MRKCSLTNIKETLSMDSLTKILFMTSYACPAPVVTIVGCDMGVLQHLHENACATACRRDSNGIVAA